MGNVLNSIILFQLADEYKEAEGNLNNYMLMRDENKVSEEEVNDLILTVKNDIEFEKLNKRLELLNFEEDEIKEEETTTTDNDDNNDNNNSSGILVKSVKKSIQQ